MIVIDSSCWIEYFSGTELSKQFLSVIYKITDIIVPTIVLNEVFKKLILSVSEKEALFAISQMEEAEIVDLTRDFALEAARLSKLFKLPLADSIIYATTLHYNATLYTLDKHFKDLPNVKYFEKK
jgi:predicted nucleic acid-binding protein